MPIQDELQSDPRDSEFTGDTRSTNRLKRTVAMYFAMVAVSTCTIFMLEHVSLTNAFRTALVAAVGKTIAANWVSSLFD